MNKTQLAEAIAQETGLSKVEARKALDASIRIAVRTLRQGESLKLTGFGSFHPMQKAARVGRNPRTGATVSVPARKAVKFRSAIDLD